MHVGSGDRAEFAQVRAASHIRDCAVPYRFILTHPPVCVSSMFSMLCGLSGFCVSYLAVYLAPGLMLRPGGGGVRGILGWVFSGWVRQISACSSFQISLGSRQPREGPVRTTM